MFEEKSFEALRDDMLDKVPNDVDKREGAIIYDALAPSAMKMAEMYHELDVVILLAFAHTSDGEFLDRRASEFGLARIEASAAVRKAVFTDSNGKPFDVAVGSRYRLNEIVYRVNKRLGQGVFELEAEMLGSIGNQEFGELLPLESVDNLGSAELVDVILPGLDQESDDSFRERLLDKVCLPATSGNVSHYKIWAREVPGVGDAKVIPLWDGPGTVKVVIVDSDKQPATTALITLVSEHIEEVRPIGASVTVVSASSKNINISAKLVLSNGYTIQVVQTNFIESLENYLESIAFTDSYLSYARIGTLLLNVPGVIDYSDLIINNGSANIPLADEEVAVLGTIELEV